MERMKQVEDPIFLLQRLKIPLGSKQQPQFGLTSIIYFGMEGWEKGMGIFMF